MAYFLFILSSRQSAVGSRQSAVSSRRAGGIPAHDMMAQVGADIIRPKVENRKLKIQFYSVRCEQRI